MTDSIPHPGPHQPAPPPNWFRRLSPGSRTAVILGGTLLSFLLLCCAGTAVVGAVFGEPEPARTGTAADVPPAPVAAAPTESSEEPAVDTPSAVPSVTSGSPTTMPASPAAAPSPVIEVRTTTTTERIPHGTRTVKDSSLAEGKRIVRTRGVDGVRTLTYQVTVTDGVPTAKKLVRSVVTKQPVTEVIAVGTKPTSSCHPNYSPCVPIASDADCAGGTGDGPVYVTGPVRVIGSDPYRLDHDKDGYGCED